MGITDRRKREKIQRRNTIIDAAEKFFSTKGLLNLKNGKIVIIRRKLNDV
jgi:DNA-binding transcriptional regulator YbjK